LAQSAKIELGAEIPLDQPSNEQGLPGIAQGEGAGAPDSSVASDIGQDGRGHRADGYWPSHFPPKGDEDSRGNTRGRPKHGHAIFGQQEKAQARS
jgi:hypothetical protein